MSYERNELASFIRTIDGPAILGGFEMADELLAAGYRKISQRRYGVFRVSDPLENTTPIENMFFDTAKRAQSWIDNGYLQPELWEVRAQAVGPWEPTA